MTETERPILTVRQREVLFITGQGLTSREIADRLHISARTVRQAKNGSSGIYAKLGAETSPQAIKFAVESGALDLEQLSKGLDMERYKDLSETERLFFNKFFDPNNLALSQKEFTGQTKSTIGTIKNRLTRIYAKLGVKNNAQAHVFKMALDTYRVEHPDIDIISVKPIKDTALSLGEVESLTLSGLGKSDIEITQTLKISLNKIKYLRHKANHKLGTTTTAQAIYLAYKNGEIKPEVFAEKFDFELYEGLTNDQKKTLDIVLSLENLSLRHKEVAQKLNIKEQSLKNKLTAIYKKLGVKNFQHALMFILSRQTNLEEKIIPKIPATIEPIQVFP